jgi:hypothetical protein
MMLGITFAALSLLCCRLLLVEGRHSVAADSNDEDANCECGISSSGAKETITEMEFRADNLVRFLMALRTNFNYVIRCYFKKKLFFFRYTKAPNLTMPRHFRGWPLCRWKATKSFAPAPSSAHGIF